MNHLERDTRRAYEAAAAAWASGPQRVYTTLAAALLDRCPLPLDGVRLLDVGAGTGVLGDEAAARGAACVDADVAVAMLRHTVRRPRRAVGADGRQLPFRSGCFDVVAGNCSLSHVLDPERMLTEAARVTRPGGAVVFSSFPNSAASHPAWLAVESVLGEYGYERPPWYRHLKTAAEPQVGTPDALERLGATAGLRDLAVDHARVATGVDAPTALVDWRLGMAQHAVFLSNEPAARRNAIRATAIERVGTEPEPLAVDLLVLTGSV